MAWLSYCVGEECEVSKELSREDGYCFKFGVGFAGVLWQTSIDRITLTNTPVVTVSPICCRIRQLHDWKAHVFLGTELTWSPQWPRPVELGIGVAQLVVWQNIYQSLQLYCHICACPPLLQRATHILGHPFHLSPVTDFLFKDRKALLIHSVMVFREHMWTEVGEITVSLWITVSFVSSQ